MARIAQHAPSLAQREEAEAQRLPGVTEQGSGQAGPWSPGCLLKHPPLELGLSLLPSPWVGVASVERDAGISSQSPVGGKRVVRSQSDVCSGSSQQRCPSSAQLESLVLYFHYPACPVEAPSGLPGSAEFIYMGAEGIGSFSGGPRILSWGALPLPSGAVRY